MLFFRFLLLLLCLSIVLEGDAVNILDDLSYILWIDDLFRMRDQLKTKKTWYVFGSFVAILLHLDRRLNACPSRGRTLDRPRVRDIHASFNFAQVSIWPVVCFEDTKQFR